MTFYRHIIKKAWEITWKFRFLWFFGLFTALLGNGGEYEIIVKTFGDEESAGLFPGLRTLADTGIFTMDGMRNVARTAATDPINFSIIIIVLLLTLAVGVFLIWLVIISQAALVNSSAKIIQNKKTAFRETLQSGISNFWPVFILNLFNRLIFSGIFVLLLIPIAVSLSLAAPLYVILFIILIPVSIFISFIIKYSIGYVVIKGQPLSAALKNGWKLFKENWLVSVEMALLLALINFALGLLAIFIVLVLSVPFLFLAAIFINFGSVAGFWLVALLGFAGFMILLFLAGAILATFQVSAWTGLFLELINKGGTSKIVRLFGKSE
jgi:hypothetical protein